MRESVGAAYNPSPPSPGGARKQPAPPPFGAGSAFGSGLEGRSLSSSWRYASAAESPDSGGGGKAGHGPYDAAAAQPWPPVGGGGVAATAPPPLASPPSPSMAMGSPTSAPGSGGGGEGGLSTGGMPAAADDGSRQQLWSPSKRPATQAGHGQQLQACVPPGMDPAAYAAGERAALMCAFQQALPGQQALGQLFSGGGAVGAHSHARPVWLPACSSSQVQPCTVCTPSKVHPCCTPLCSRGLPAFEAGG